ncbi:MAG: hypothetical protein NUW21_01490, partial [Elusimicrobia bacterium]|nr:hypothetical protein [Elusimicrobiota bacterium]
GASPPGLADPPPGPMILALALLAAGLASAADPLAAVDASWRDKGYQARDRVSGEDGELTANAVIYTPAEGGGDRLEIYVVARGKAYLGFTHPSRIERLEFDPSPAGRFADMFGDGSMTLAYRATRVALGATELNILRWKRFKIERIAVFPEGRFLRLETGPVVASRELPLGRYLSMGCENFGTISRTAFKTVLSEPRARGFKDVSSKHPRFYRSEIERKEKALGRLRDDLENHTGEYLGLAISTYYDYAAMGRAREGWTRLRAFFKIPALVPASVKTCMAEMERDLRRKLAVPASWP